MTFLISQIIADEGCTVRVTNLSENARDSDLQELFGRIGEISRIFLSKVSSHFLAITHSNLYIF